MPRYSYSNPARRTQAAPAAPIVRKLERPSAERIAKLERPSTAKTLKGVTRKSSDG